MFSHIRYLLLLNNPPQISDLKQWQSFIISYGFCGLGIQRGYIGARLSLLQNVWGLSWKIVEACNYLKAYSPTHGCCVQCCHTHIWPCHVTRASSPHGGWDSRTSTWARWKLTWGSLHIPPQNPSTIFHWPRKILAEIQGQRTFNSHLGSQKCSQPCKKVKWDGVSIPMLGK